MKGKGGSRCRTNGSVRGVWWKYGLQIKLQRIRLQRKSWGTTMKEGHRVEVTVERESGAWEPQGR